MRMQTFYACKHAMRCDTLVLWIEQKQGIRNTREVLQGAYDRAREESATQNCICGGCRTRVVVVVVTCCKAVNDVSCI